MTVICCSWVCLVPIIYGTITLNCSLYAAPHATPYSQHKSRLGSVTVVLMLDGSPVRGQSTSVHARHMQETWGINIKGVLRCDALHLSLGNNSRYCRSIRLRSACVGSPLDEGDEDDSSGSNQSALQALSTLQNNRIPFSMEVRD